MRLAFFFPGLFFFFFKSFFFFFWIRFYSFACDTLEGKRNILVENCNDIIFVQVEILYVFLETIYIQLSDGYS